MKLYLCATYYDDCTVPLEESFVLQRMNNRIFPRLLGMQSEDGLTTPTPSLDKRGRHTILVDLHIRSTPLLHLLQLLRTGQLPADLRQEAYEVSLRLGGFEEVDRFMADPVPPPIQAYVPMLPEEDPEGTYQWTVSNINNGEAMAELRQEGWSATCFRERYYMLHCRRRSSQ